MVTKLQIKKQVTEKVAAEKERIIKLMQEVDIYSRTLDPLIESYLDTYEIYETMFLQWQAKGFPTTQKHTNKAGATNEAKHPLAQLVETWSDKKVKQLDMLGLSNRNIKIDKKIAGGSRVNHDDIMTKPDEVVDQLAAHREKWRKKA